jgi:hypothetical protein
MDIETSRTNPFIAQDILIYNYLKYEVTDKLSPSASINKYVKEVIKPQVKIRLQAVELLKNLYS